VDDLAELVDHVRTRTGRGQVTLLGYSWGAGVSSRYAAEHPDRVAGLAFLSPGALPLQGRTEVVTGPQARLDLPDQLRLYLVALRPKNLFVYALSTIDPDTAHELVDDPEADARYAELYRLSSPGLFCDQGRPVEVPVGLGHFANAVPVADDRAEGLDGAALQRLSGQPVLALRGECDYLPRAAALTYPEHLPRARLVDVSGAGHAVLLERPDVVLRQLRSFLAGIG